MKIKDIANSSDKRRLFSNFLFLTVLQGANYILPLVTLPYLVRVLGTEKFGLIAFAQAFIQYFVILTDYGFNLSATREISVHRDNKEKISEIFSSVIIIKFILLTLSLLIMTIIVFSFEKFRQDWIIYYLTFGIVIGQVLFPVWFFQGMEKMKYVTFLNITAKLIFTIFIFIFIHETSDFVYVPLINSLGFIVAGFLAIWIILRDFKLHLKVPSFSFLKSMFLDSFHFFLSRVSVSVYTTTNTFIIGLFLGNTYAGFYSAVEKIFYALISIYQPLNDALYPFVSRKKDVLFFKKVFYISLKINLVICLILFIFSDNIIYILYGEGFEISAQLLKIFSVLGLIMVPAVLLGYPFVAALGYPKYANYSVVIASLIHIVLLILIIPVINIYLVVFIMIVSQIFVLTIRIYGIKKHKLWGV